MSAHELEIAATVTRVAVRCSAWLGVIGLALKIVIAVCVLYVVLRRPRWSDRDNIKRALVAFVIEMIYMGPNQYRLLAMFKTVGTKPVLWLGAAVIWLEGANKDATGNLLKFVARGFGVPLFILYELLFCLAFNVGQLLIFGLGGIQLGLKVEDAVLEVENHLLGFGVVDSLKNARDQFCGVRGSGNSSSELGNHNL